MNCKARLGFIIAFGAVLAASVGDDVFDHKEEHKIAPRMGIVIPHCNCNELTCQCCMEVTFSADQQKSACITFQLNPNNLILKINFAVNGCDIENVEVGPQSFPVCIPFAPSPAMLCLLAEKVHFEIGYVTICTTFQVRVLGKVIYEAKLPGLEYKNGQFSVINNCLVSI